MKVARWPISGFSRMNATTLDASVMWVFFPRHVLLIPLGIKNKFVHNGFKASEDISVILMGRIFFG